jgi:hypothetical protein
MLVTLALTKDDVEFWSCLNDVQTAYWPKMTVDAKFKADLPNDRAAYDRIGGLPDRWRERLGEYYDEVAREVNEQEKGLGLYHVRYENTEHQRLPLPFIDRFLRFFLIREWDSMPIGLGYDGDYTELYRLEQPDAGSKNHSKNYGNYCHMVNVVAIAARLIGYFSNRDHIKQVLIKEKDRKKWDHCIDDLIYQKNEPLRIFSLMLAAFYHDLGKTVVDVRHGMEGAIIMLDHASRNLYQVQRIAESYHDESAAYDHESMLFLSDMLLFHDLFGTLSTGESGYFKLVYPLDAIQRYSLGYVTLAGRLDSPARVKWSRRLLFDLWLLNLADILASLEYKYELQVRESSRHEVTHLVNWAKKDEADAALSRFFNELELKPVLSASPESDWVSDLDSGKLPQTLRELFEGKKVVLPMNSSVSAEIPGSKWRIAASDSNRGYIILTPGQEQTLYVYGEGRQKAHLLVHDLRIALPMLDSHSQTQHVDDISILKAEALESAKRHAVERVRRLIYESIYNESRKLLAKYRKEGSDDWEDLLVRWEAQLERYFESEDKLNICIVRAIKSVADFQEFCNRISFVGQLDYALGFFQKIAAGALSRVLKELKQPQNLETHTGWVSTTPQEKLGASYMEIQVKYFMENYTATVINIISHLLFREESFGGLRNLEFNDASQRLTDDKIQSIVSLKGPSRARRSTQLILQSIFYW